MELEIITDNLKLVKHKFDSYLNNYLKTSMETKINFIKYGFDTRKFNFFIFYDENKFNSNNYNNHSIYYGFLEKEEHQIYFFGSDNDINFNNKIVPRIAISLNIHDLDYSGIVFGRDDEGKEYLLMKLNFDHLGKHQTIVLNTYNDICEIKNEFYINLGCFDNNIEILRNLRNFISKITIDECDVNCLILKSMKIPNEYIQLLDLPEDYAENIDIYDLDKNTYCMHCGHEINMTYELNKELKRFAGANPNKCASCFSKLLIRHFQLKIDGKFKTKLDLEYLSENNNLINFYIDLSEKAGLFGTDNELQFNMNLSEFDKFLDEIPNDLIIEGNVMGNNKKKNKKLKGKLKKRKEIDKLTRKSSGRSYNYFEKLLEQYQLSYKDGQEIRQMLLNDLNDDKLSGDIRGQIKKYVIQLSSENKDTNIFKLSNKLNKLTLKDHNTLNDDFIKKLEEYSLSEEDGWEIRDEIIDKINNRIIVHPNTVEKRLNELIEKRGTLKSIDEINIEPSSETTESENEFEDQEGDEELNIKEYILIDNYCHLNYICRDNECINMIKFLSDESSISLENLIISKISKEMSKVSVDCKILDDADSIKDRLIQNNFKELVIK